MNRKLESIVNDGDISEDNRLLTLLDDNEIENARDAVSFGQLMIESYFLQ